MPGPLGRTGRVGVAGGGAAYFALGGAVSVEIIDSDTTAYIGTGAGINQRTLSTADFGSAHANQSVSVTAVNDVSSISAAAGVASML